MVYVNEYGISNLIRPRCIIVSMNESLMTCGNKKKKNKKNECLERKKVHLLNGI